jgi:ABC-type lipoprotein release transport system permease subunit
LQSPLDPVFSFGGALAWLVAVISIAGAASFVPARRAARLSVQAALAYE